MTNGEFITQQLRAFGVTDADLATVDVKLDDELDVSVAEQAMIPLLAVLACKPYQKSINENGFSVSWDMSKIGWWYRYLCSKYGVKPDVNVMEALGLSVIVDRTSKW
jgi:hypothetical protein